MYNERNIQNQLQDDKWNISGLSGLDLMRDYSTTNCSEVANFQQPSFDERQQRIESFEDEIYKSNSFLENPTDGAQNIPPIADQDNFLQIQQTGDDSFDKLLDARFSMRRNRPFILGKENLKRQKRTSSYNKSYDSVSPPRKTKRSPSPKKELPKVTEQKEYTFTQIHLQGIASNFQQYIQPQQLDHLNLQQQNNIPQKQQRVELETYNLNEAVKPVNKPKGPQMPEWMTYKENGEKQLKIWREEFENAKQNGASTKEKITWRNRITALEHRLKKRELNIKLEKLSAKKEQDFVTLLNICKRVLANQGDYLQNMKDMLKEKYPEDAKHFDEEDSDSESEYCVTRVQPQRKRSVKALSKI